MKTVIDTGKVKIGLAYETPKKLDVSADMEKLQTALLYPSVPFLKRFKFRLGSALFGRLMR